MADFQVAYQIVHGHEGGYANVAGDKGGETYMGISRRWHPEWPGWVGIDAWKALHGQPKRGQYLEVAGLLDKAVAFYKVQWDYLRGDNIKNQAVANQLYDFVTGTGSAVRIAQDVLVGMGFSLKPDNVFGLQTLTAINAADAGTFHSRLKVARIAYYHKLVADDPSQAKFLSNWLERANHFLSPQKKTLD